MKQAGSFMLPNADTYFAPFLEQGGFQLDHLHAALRFVDHFGIALDGGAHVGSWTREMARKFEGVIAVEPAKDTYACLCANTHDHPNVRTVNALLGAEMGAGDLIDDDSRRGNTGSRFMRIRREGTIPIITIDSLGLEGLDFLKLDVEGTEYYALLGATNTIRQNQPVVVIEEKGFGRRYDLQPFAASNLLLSWGAHRVAQIGKDHVFIFN